MVNSFGDLGLLKTEIKKVKTAVLKRYSSYWPVLGAKFKYDLGYGTKYWRLINLMSLQC